MAEKEYIERRKLKERLEDFSQWCRDGRKQGVDFVLDGVLPDMLAADVVEVVRCKDCKNYRYEKVLNYYECDIFMGAYEITGYPTKPDDFCSYGERKAATP